MNASSEAAVALGRLGASVGLLIVGATSLCVGAASCASNNPLSVLAAAACFAVSTAAFGVVLGVLRRTL